MTGRNKRHLGVTRTRHQTASSRDEFAGFFEIFSSRKGSRPSVGSLARDLRCMLIMYWHSLSCTAACWVQLGLGGLPELILEFPVRFPKRLLKLLGLRLSYFWVKCLTSDCDKTLYVGYRSRHFICAIPPLKNPKFVLAKTSVGKTEAWPNPSAHWKLHVQIFTFCIP